MRFIPTLLGAAALSALTLLAGCATTPTGPAVAAMPGSGKSFDQFRADDAECRAYAMAQLNGQDPNQAAVQSGVASAALGTAVGALAGAAVGGRYGSSAGAGSGLVMGSMIGMSAAQSSASGVQRRIDIAYMQCMYAKGHQVPMTGGMQQQRPAAPAAPAAPVATQPMVVGPGGVLVAPVPVTPR